MTTSNKPSIAFLMTVSLSMHCVPLCLSPTSPQHGKDFEAIQNNIALKYKKKGKPASMVKNKEQVRHFYYRTWHKISKHIDFNNGEVDACSAHVAHGFDPFIVSCSGDIFDLIGGVDL